MIEVIKLSQTRNLTILMYVGRKGSWVYSDQASTPGLVGSKDPDLGFLPNWAKAKTLEQLVREKSLDLIGCCKAANREFLENLSDIIHDEMNSDVPPTTVSLIRLPKKEHVQDVILTIRNGSITDISVIRR